MRTYAYGALAPTENAEIVREQVWRAHRYKNTLIEIARNRIAVVEAIWKPYNEARKAEFARVEAAGGDPNKVPKSVLSPRDAAAADYAYEVANGYAKAAQHASGVYWGTYLVIEDAVQRAGRSGGLPVFKRWDGSGMIAVQLQHGISVAELLAGDDTRARLTGTGKHRILRVRVGSDGRAPVWAAFPVVYHRDLPPEARIKWVRCVARRVATKIVWSAQFVLDGVDARLPSPTESAIGIDVGWRKFSDGLRVATWVDDTGRLGELRLSQTLLDRWHKVDDLQSIRDKNFEDEKYLLGVDRRKAASTWPEWLRQATETLYAWKSLGRLASVANRWRTERFDGDEVAFARLDAWRRQDKHLYEWQANQRENVLRARREQYRIFARFAARYARVVVEDLDLRDFAELPKKDEKDAPATKKARPRRHFSALSELRECVEDAVGRAGGAFVMVPPKYTTQTCAACGHREAFGAAVEVSHTCSQCSVTWDQDVNAARNILRAGETCETAARLSQDEGPGVAVESKAAARRRRGLETRRAKRSKMLRQDAGLTTE